MRRRLNESWKRAGVTPFVIVLLLFWWFAVTLWYPIRFSIWVGRRELRKHRKHTDEALHEPRA